MRKRIGALALLGTIALSQPVPTRSGSNLRTGFYPDDTLTPQAISQRGLRVYFSLPMEGDALGSESQILIAENVPMQDGGKRNVCIVSALNNLVWAYDCDSSDILWVEKLGVPIKSSGAIDFWKTADHIGVLSTGVIDTETNTWYGVAWVSPDATPQNGKHYIYGLNLRDGSFAFPAVQMPAEYDASMRKQRVSLALAKFGGKKTVLFGSGTVLEVTPTSAGYLTAFDIESRKVTMFALAQQGNGAGIWQSGSGLIVDGEAIYGVTGNGSFDPEKGNWAETVFRASYHPPMPGTTGHFAIEDWWTPYSDQWRANNAGSPQSINLQRLSGHSLSTADTVNGTKVNQPVNGMHMHATGNMAMGDEDLGSAPCNYAPQFDELLCAGKDSIGLMVRLSNMGRTQPADLADSTAANYAKLWIPPFWYGTFHGFGVPADSPDAATLNNDVMIGGKTTHVHSASVVAGNRVYVGAENNNVRAWQLNSDHSITYLANSDDVASPDLVNTQNGGMTGWFCAAATSGILACTRPHGDANRTVTAGDLFIFDSQSFETRPDGSKRLKVLWRSDQQNIGFQFNKFCPPVIWGGKVYVPTFSSRTIVLGLN